MGEWVGASLIYSSVSKSGNCSEQIIVRSEWLAMSDEW